eukprot:11699652-Heterocapsa_arctica.AAC.1
MKAQRRLVGLARRTGARSCNLCEIAKPPTFDGNEKHWPDFRFKFEAVLSLIGLRELLNLAAAWPGHITVEECSPQVLTKSHLLYLILLQTCSGKALAILRLVKDNHGLDVWRVLVHEYAPTNASRSAAMLTGLLQPKWADDIGQFAEALLGWEKALDEYEAVSGKLLPEEVKTAVLSRRAPSVVRRFLQVNPTEYETYADMKLAIQKFLQKGRYYDASGFTDCVDMDVSVLAPANVGMLNGSAQWRSSQPQPGQGGGRDKGKAGGKDGGRGKARGVRPCWKCGGAHLAWNCMKGSGKGGGA